MQMIETILNVTRDHMRKALEVTRTDLSSIRSGRATPALVENIYISAYGGTQKLKLLEMATISAQDAKSILISPYDPSQVGEITKSIQEANTGLNPVSEGDVLRITIPPLSEERRREYIKLAKVKLEAGRIMVRQVRQESMKDLKREQESGSISEDELKQGEKKVQELTDEMIAEIDAVGDKKEQELLQV
jgi:ribosome recycling factor